MNIKVKINEYNKDLYCTHSKLPIESGEVYIIAYEETADEIIEKYYKTEFIEILAEEDDPYSFLSDEYEGEL